MKAPDLLRMADAYSIFRPNKLIFARIDETLDYSALVECARHLRLPISFLSTGQRIPEDIEPATRRRLTDLLEGTSMNTQRRGATA